MPFCTVVRELQSPKNVGMIVRSHVALGGGRLVFLGYDAPWEFKKGTKGFSRRLERECDFETFAEDAAFFEWCDREGLSPVALEIAEEATPAPQWEPTDPVAIVVGHEGGGLPEAFRRRCDRTVVVPQYGPVGSLNVAVAASMGMYEAMRGEEPGEIRGSKYEGEGGEP